MKPDLTDVHRPVFFHLDDPEDHRRLEALLAETPSIAVSDRLMPQLEELAAVREPRIAKNEAARREAALGRLNGRDPKSYGVWVYYPWARSLVHVLPSDELREVRLSRNRYKITADEQEVLLAARIGIVGLSVGHSIAVTLALEGIGGEIRLADFDEMALSNMNRVSCASWELGLNKAIVAARRLVEIDPYLRVTVFPDGLTDANQEDFLIGDGRLDLVIEECDDLYMKVRVRELARELRIPVLMDTNDRGLVDVERFDLEPERAVLHGLIGATRAESLRGLDTQQKVPFVLAILGEEQLSDRLTASLLEIDRTVAGWPQLASGTMLGGAVIADVARRTLLGELRSSGRFHVDLEALVAPREVRPVEAHPPAPSHTPAPGTQTRGQNVGREEIRQLVALGAMAPSGGNNQPWRFLLRDHRRLSCFLDETRATSRLDFRGRAACLAMGAAVESMMIASPALGMIANAKPFPDPSSPRLLCELELEPARSIPEPELFRWIPKRATNRRIGVRLPLEHGVYDRLIATANEAGMELDFATEDERLREIGTLLGDLDRFRFFCKPLWQEMFDEIRWTREEAESTGDGIDLRTLELGPTDLAGIRLMRRPNVIGLLRHLGAGSALARSAQLAIGAASGVGLLWSRRSGDSAFFEGGRALQRVWLTATSLGLSIQPVSACLYMFARLVEDEGAGFEEREAESLRSLRRRFMQLFPSSSDRSELLLFRIFKAEEPSVRSIRRPVDDILFAG